ncbi:MAG: IS5/IS1182 family transposase, partial [Endozoicomonadaceae bacterium]|nr:IS5/IS1182 family transposase [Endozoicomonadaceae bacterium]
IDFEITGGEVHDSKMAYSLMLKIKEADYFIADKG